MLAAKALTGLNKAALIRVLLAFSIKFISSYYFLVAEMSNRSKRFKDILFPCW